MRKSRHQNKFTKKVKKYQKDRDKQHKPKNNRKKPRARIERSMKDWQKGLLKLIK